MKPVDAFILNQPEPYKAIVLHLIAVISGSFNALTLEFKYGVPYFYCNQKPFCYLAPNIKKNYVDLGIAKGFQLKYNQDILISENRNTVKSLRYSSLEAIDHNQLLSVLTEAMSLY
ncbi:DUF1801 domain-containing protein [Flavobacterium aciduliphilum]|uniref:Uncharacterized protein DUF1801 n=1 Tax=Flavobacterium aciduliphilum TaxID=1101402 RepID=A0A328YDE7_9FLAO|nr:DUF1801 domain-containing protein [Flavobacterium aciduliphilum]RAR70132.1 uncharacterized protein DUF1801 [Flavobacterium aciduliphilum]